MAKKKEQKPDSNFRGGTSAELGVCSRPVWVSAYCGTSSKRPPWKWWILWWIFAVFWSQNAKEKSSEKIRGKICQPKTENPPAHDPPEIHQSGPKIRRKTYHQIGLSNLHVHARLFSIEKACFWRRLQSMDSGTLFGCLLRMVELDHAEMHLQSLSCSGVGGTRFASHPSRQHLLGL